MNTREIAQEYRLANWAKIMQERKNSGMSIKDFCKTAGFHENVYFYWQRKLREAACQQLQQKKESNDKAIVPQGWAVCESVAHLNKSKALPVEVGGCRVLVSDASDLELLSKVCRVLSNL